MRKRATAATAAVGALCARPRTRHAGSSARGHAHAGATHAMQGERARTIRIDEDHEELGIGHKSQTHRPASCDEEASQRVRARRGRRSWPRRGWIPVFSAAGEVPETHQVGHWTANARALQAAPGGCGLIRWVRRTFHFVCCFARLRIRHSDAAGGCLANVPCTHRWRCGRAADDPGRFRTLGGRPVHMAMPSCRSVDRHPQRPPSSEVALRAHTGRHWPLPSGSNAESQVASGNIGLGRFY